MTNQLTDEQRETLARAKAREGQTTPAPWVRMNGGQVMAGRYIEPRTSVYDAERRGVYVISEDDHYINIDAVDAELITDAPNLDALAIAQSDIIAQQAARIAELEAERADERTYVNELEGRLGARLSKWDEQP